MERIRGVDYSVFLWYNNRVTQLPTKKQKQLLDYLSQYIQKHGYSPTHDEMCDALDVSSVATVHDHLLQLAKKRLIKIYHGAVRGVEVIPQKISAAVSGLITNLQLPLLGYIAAGSPIEAIENRSESITVPSSMVTGRKRSFVLQVRGESMIEDGILDGDYVVIEQQETADNGDIVVALLENGFATLKRYFKEKTRIRLEPANAKMQPIYAREVKIQGKVRGVLRRY